MIIRQQVSSMIANGKLITTHAKAKEASRHVDYVINLAKKDTLANKRAILSILIDVNGLTPVEILNKALNIAKKYAARNGGYTKVLKLGTRPGDNTEEAILSFV